MRRRILNLLSVSILLSIPVLLAPPSASAEDSVTITIGAESLLLDSTLIEVPVQITCAPMDFSFNMGNSELRQAVSKQLIAHGIGNAQDPFVCDGQPHQNSYLFWADSSGPPFAKGDATVTVNVFLCDSSFVCQSGSSGIQTTSVKRH